MPLSANMPVPKEHAGNANGCEESNPPILVCGKTGEPNSAAFGPPAMFVIGMGVATGEWEGRLLAPEKERAGPGVNIEEEEEEGKKREDSTMEADPICMLPLLFV